MPRRNIVAEIMAEKVSYGGFVATRLEVYSDIIGMGHSQLHADRMCHTLKQLPADEAARMLPFRDWKDRLPR